MVEQERTDEVEPERDAARLPQPDETGWWEKQLGTALPWPDRQGGDSAASSAAAPG